MGDGTEVAVGAAFATFTTPACRLGVGIRLVHNRQKPLPQQQQPRSLIATTATLVEPGESSIFLIRSDKAIRTCLSPLSSFWVPATSDPSRLGRTSVYRVEIIHRRWMPSPFCVSKRGTRRAKQRRRGFTATQQQTRRVVSRNAPTCIPPCTSRGRDSAFPAHIASLVRAPLRKRRGRTYFLSCHSQHPHSLRAFPCHSERSEKSPPFAKRTGARGMPCHPINAETPNNYHPILKILPKSSKS